MRMKIIPICKINAKKSIVNCSQIQLIGMKTREEKKEEEGEEEEEAKIIINRNMTLFLL